jgi:hypothetical protein
MGYGARGISSYGGRNFSSIDIYSMSFFSRHWFYCSILNFFDIKKLAYKYSFESLLSVPLDPLGMYPGVFIWQLILCLAFCVAPKLFSTEAATFHVPTSIVWRSQFFKVLSNTPLFSFLPSFLPPSLSPFLPSLHF